MSSPAPARGIALVEALIAMTLLCVGLAGTALLLVRGLRAQHEAGYRVVARAQAASLADALRALRRADGLALQAVTAPLAAPACTLPADCAIERSAQRQIDDWQRGTVALLPAGSQAAVAALDAAAPAYLVSIAWPVPGDAAGARLRLAVEP